MSDLPEHVSETPAPRTATEVHLIDFTLPSAGVDFNSLVEDYENRLISIALSQTSGNKKAAARLLGLNRTTLVEKIKKKGLEGKIEVLVESDSLTM
jgi:DNA-binding NtrC family response regulator